MNSRQAAREDWVRLANHLQRRRGSLLQAWRKAVDADAQISTAATLARSQFVDHIPRVLDGFDAQLRALVDNQVAEAAEQQRRAASDHGVQRWLHGYHYRETMREWGHLHVCLAAEVERLTRSEPDLNPRTMATARQMLVQLFVDCMVESAAGQVHLEETEASTRLRELEQALEQLKLLERERAELWREAAHDLRGNVGAVRIAADVLARRASADTSALVIERTTRSLSALLDELVVLARLQSGREQRSINEFDAGLLIQELCEQLRPIAGQRQLTLRAEALSFTVSGDPVKVRRIAQNLVLNALKFTERGGVQVIAAELHVGAVRSWQLCVQDTGVGFSERNSPAITQLLSTATRESEALDAHTRASALPPIQTLRSESNVAPRETTGEGVGLTIVKRLCELLDATIQVESAPGRGTTFRVVFPVAYAPAPANP